MTEINKDEVKRIDSERMNSAKQLTIDYLFYVLADKEDVTNYRKEILRKINIKGQKKPELLPEDMAKLTAKLLEDCSGETNSGDFTAKLALATAGWDVFGKEYNFSELKKLPIQEKEKVFVEYKERKKEAEIILDSLLDYNILEKKGARINARGTLKEIIKGNYIEKNKTVHDYQDELKNQILAEKQKKENGIEQKVEKEVTINLPDRTKVNHSKPAENKQPEEKKKYNLFRWFLLGSLAVSTALAYTERKDVYNFFKNRINYAMDYVGEKRCKDELKDKTYSNSETVKNLKFAEKMLKEGKK